MRPRTKWNENLSDMDFNIVEPEEVNKILMLLNSPELIEANEQYMIEMRPKKRKRNIFKKPLTLP